MWNPFLKKEQEGEDKNLPPIQYKEVTVHVRKAIEINGSWTTIECGAQASVRAGSVQDAFTTLFNDVAGEINRRIKAITMQATTK